MHKIILIIKREYLTRVRKKSFLVMTILGPLLMAAIVIVPIYLATKGNELKTVAVIDQTGIFYEKFKNTDNIKFHYLLTILVQQRLTSGKAGIMPCCSFPKLR